MHIMIQPNLRKLLLEMGVELIRLRDQTSFFPIKVWGSFSLLAGLTSGLKIVDSITVLMLVCNPTLEYPQNKKSREKQLE